MGCRWWAAAVAVLSWISVFSSVFSSARGAITINSGLLQASARAGNGTTSSFNFPADVPFVLPSTSHGASAFVGGPGGASISVFETVSYFGGISVKASTSISSLLPGEGQFDTQGAVGGSLSFTESASETVGVSLFNSSSFSDPQFHVLDSPSHILYGTNTPGSANITLAPGTYTLEWQIIPIRPANLNGAGGASSIQFFFAPEPSALALLGLAPLYARRRRRHG